MSELFCPAPDETYKRFVVSPPPGAVIVKTNWRDNLALSEELRIEIEHLRTTDPDEFEYVYEGMCRQAVEGAICRNELLLADKEGGGDMKKGTYLLKAECQGCGYTCRVTKKWVVEKGAPICPCNVRPMAVDLPDDDDGDGEEDLPEAA